MHNPTNPTVKISQDILGIIEDTFESNLEGVVWARDYDHITNCQCQLA